jgi:hypothetical protein
MSRRCGFGAARIGVMGVAMLAATAGLAATWVVPSVTAADVVGFGPKWSLCGLGMGLAIGGAMWSRLSPAGGLLAFSAGALLMAAGCN